MAKYNILVKRDKEHTYLIKDFMATSLSKNKFEKLKDHNKTVLMDSEILINDFINYGTYENYIMLKRALEDRQINFINSENLENENDIKDLIILKNYSYRF